MQSDFVLGAKGKDRAETENFPQVRFQPGGRGEKPHQNRKKYHGSSFVRSEFVPRAVGKDRAETELCELTLKGCAAFIFKIASIFLGMNL